MHLILPEIPGKYPVGTTTFAAPVSVVNDGSRIVGTATLKSSTGAPAGTPALKLEEVAFTAFYPADTASTRTGSRTAGWVPRPVEGTLRGYAYFGELGIFLRLLVYIFGVFAHILKFSAYPNAKLLDPKHRSDASGQPWPLVIFSHGLAGTRTSYTHLCTRLASQGKIVLALEHRDGTGPFVLTRTPVPGVDSKGVVESKLYLNPNDVDINTKEGEDPLALRAEQLHFRRLEIYLAYTAFKHLVTSKYDTSLDLPDIQRMHTIDGLWNFKLRSREKDRLFWQSWEPTEGGPKVQCDSDLCLAGHSFGGATLLSLLTNPPPRLGEQEFPQLPVTHAIALDPWVQPLPSPVPSPVAVESSLRDHPRVLPQLLVINSESFTLWQEHFPRLQDIVNIWNSSAAEHGDGLRARLLSIVRCKHISFSDFGVFFAFGRTGREGRRYLDTIYDLSLGFLDGHFESALQRQGKASGEVEIYNKKGPPGDTKGRKFVGNAGDVVVHI